MNVDEVPRPPRPLGPAGEVVWREAIAEAGLAETESLLVLCETVDERVALRLRVLRESNADDRKALRELDDRVAHLRFILHLDPGPAMLLARLDAAIGELELGNVKRPIAAICRALAIGLEEATARGDPHGSAAVARELRGLYHELTGPMTDDPFAELLERFSTPTVGDAPAA